MDKSYRELLKPGEPDFWKNFWFYNKKIIISVLVAVIVIVFTAVRCASIPEPDAEILILTRNSRVPEVTENLEETFSALIEDINGDGKATAVITEVAVPRQDSAELQTSNEIKAVNQLVNGNSTVIVAEKELLEVFLEIDGLFEEASEGKLICNSKGKPVATDITEKAFAKDMDYYGTDTLCIAVKAVDKASENYDMYIQGKIIAEYIIKN